MTVPTTTQKNVVRKQQQEAIQARWARDRAKKNEWESMPLDEAKRILAEMRADIEAGAGIIQQRISAQAATMSCVICNAPIKGIPVSIVPRKDIATGLAYNDFYCSVECVARKNQRDTGILTLTR